MSNKNTSKVVVDVNGTPEERDIWYSSYREQGRVVHYPKLKENEYIYEDSHGIKVLTHLALRV